MKKTVLLFLLAIGSLSGALARKGNLKADNNYAGYLFVYFEGQGEEKLKEHLRFAVSDNAEDWYALNGNRPVVASDTISESGGIRDPHILRGEDGMFYLVATDMNVHKNDWGSNPGIVLMKSADLITWTHASINLSRDYPENFGDAYWVWAPQTIYDRKVGKYMIYFTLRRKDESKGLVTYYAYVNSDFTAFESEPKILFNAKYGSIDNDIVYKDGTYHLFYKGNTKDAEGKEIKNGIQQAISKNLTGKWKEDFKYLDAYAGRTPVEGSGVFKLNGEEKYVLMYDLYTSERYEYQTSTDLYRFSQEPRSFRKDFSPRHGTVMSLTAEELERLQQKWGYVLKHDFISEGNPIIRDKHTADPAVLVKNDTLWLFAGHDYAGNQSKYVMRDWLLYSTTDMKHWTEYPSPLHINEFAWAKSRQAYAGHVVERNGKFYWYVSTNWCGIGVAVADKITGPYKDALGKPLLTNEDCFASTHSWACIDPAVFIDDDGQAYIVWGNRECYYAKLKENMTEIDGNVKQISLKDFTEAPWVHKRDGKYYLTYATGWSEKIAYAVSDNIGGPYEYKGIISEIAGNSNTTHPAIVEFKGCWIFFSHNGGLEDGTSYSRSVIAEPMEYNADGTIRKIHPTTEGVEAITADKVPTEKDMAAYLLAYFTDADHSLHFAISHDGYTFTAVNNGEAIISGDSIAEQRGIRDPHIYRGPDGAFYLAMTDLHIYAKEKGLRTTRWERPDEYGWGNNRGLVLMKSKDLINWTHTEIRIDKAFPKEFGEIGCAWAPQTTYDPVKKSLMIYFTIRKTGEKLEGGTPTDKKTRLYYAYTDEAFTRLTTEPKLLYEYPDSNIQVLDADICPMPDGRYFMTYVAQENPGGIKMAVSDKINEGYNYMPEQIDSEKGSCEAPNTWKRIGENKWVVMYDIFSIQPHNFGFVETSDFKTFTPLGRFNEGPMKTTNFQSPKHGAVIQITAEEAARLENHWK